MKEENKILRVLQELIDKKDFSKVLQEIENISLELYDIEFNQKINDYKKYALNNLHEQKYQKIYSSIERERLFPLIITNKNQFKDEILETFLKRFKSFNEDEIKKINTYFLSQNIANEHKIYTLCLFQEYDVNIPIIFLNNITLSKTKLFTMDAHHKLFYNRIMSRKFKNKILTPNISDTFGEILHAIENYYVFDSLNISDEKIIENLEILLKGEKIDNKFKDILTNVYSIMNNEAD